jgi:lysozyme family protein
MAAPNFEPALAFVWLPGYDDPADGYHTTTGDMGGGTLGGVIEATWAKALNQGIVEGLLANASPAQLEAVLKADFWGPACDALPPGLDLALFNGRMMSGFYGHLFQQALGFTGLDVDGIIGQQTVAAAKARDPVSLLWTLTGVHYAYLTGLVGWDEFGRGWTKRLLAARSVALNLMLPAPPPATAPTT